MSGNQKKYFVKHVISKNGFYLGIKKSRFPDINEHVCAVLIIAVSIAIGAAIGLYK